MKASACPSGKIRYPDKLAARVSLVSARRNHDGRRAVENRVYRCPDCAGWHLTHKKRKRWT